MPGHSPESSASSARSRSHSFQKKISASVAVMATLALLATSLVVLTAGPAGALVGTPFEIDGDDQATAGGLDWSNFPTANLLDEDDVANSNDDDSFGGADEDDYIDVPVVSQGVPTNNDLTRFRLAVERRSGNDFLYLAWDRLPANGTTTISFELNKLEQAYPGPGAGNGNEWDILRSEGDVLITFDLGSSGNDPALYMSRWLVTNSPTTPCAVSNHVTPCWSVPVQLTLGGALADAAVDETLNQRGARVPPTFGEAAINLTATGILPAGSCETFANSYAKSRSSLPLGSDLQDLVFPSDQIVISNCGSLSVAKTVVDDPGTTAFGFTVDCGDYALSSVNLADTTVDYTTAPGDAKFSLGDAESKTFADVPAGTECSVVEADATSPGGTWTTTYTIGSGDPQPGKNTGSQTLTAGQTVAVEFTNSFDAAAVLSSITIIKDALPDDAQNFAFTTDTDLAPSAFELDDDADPTLSNTRAFNDLPPGEYAVTESISSGWILTDIRCVGGTVVIDEDDRTARITLAAGDHVRCTFENQRVASLVPEVDLSITKTDDVDPITLGDGDVTYTLVITNNSVTDATNVVVSDRLPSSVTFRSASAGCTHTGGIVTCVVGDLRAGETATATVAVTPTAAGTLVNSATVSGDEPDPDPSNNTDGEETSVTEVLGETATRPPVAPATPPAVLGVAVARTGGSPGPLALAGTLAFLLGGLMLIASRPARAVRRSVPTKP